MSEMDRRTFIGAAAAAAASPLWARAKDAAEIRAVLVHLGHNMWCDWYPEGFDLEKVRKGFPKSFPDTELRCRDDLWKESTDYVAAKGMNMLVIDIGEGLVFPSHPELAIRGSWTPDRLRAEIARLNALGLEVIPTRRRAARTGSAGSARPTRSTPTTSSANWCASHARTSHRNGSRAS